MQLHIRLDLESEQVQANLLSGLEYWLRLGLISNTDIQTFAAILTEPLPVPEQATERLSATVTDSLSPVAVMPIETATAMASSAAEKRAATPHFVSRLMRSLVAEISVIWLLFLGVFLVVVSSGVLAASQWQAFSSAGQYGILFAYTLCFWGASRWAHRQPHLQTTARMLTLTTLLIIPINFWVMDALGVAEGSLGLGVAGLATVILSSLPFTLLTYRRSALNILGLSWLHWGWGWGNWPLLATYIGILGTATDLTTQARSTEEEEANRLLSFDTLTIALSLLILLARGLWVSQIPLYQLGLALGLCGWLWVWVTRQKTSRGIWGRVGWGLLLWGWVVAVGQEPPWQAIGVSGLALWLLGTKLRVQPSRWGLLQLTVVSFQAYWLLWFTIPSGVRAAFLTTLSDAFSQTPIQGEAWASIGFFPYLLGLLWLASKLRQQEQPTLSKQVEVVSLLLGIFLSLLSLTNSFSAVVNLSLSTLTLALRDRVRTSTALIELAHMTGIIALLAWIDYLAPDLSGEGWATVGLSIAIAEWLMGLLLRHPRWRQSTWRMGIIAAAITYPLLLVYGFQEWPLPHPWRWLTIPITLTLVANHQRAPKPQAAVGFSLIAFVLQTPWLSTWPVTIGSFAIGTLCTALNSRVWRNTLVTLFAVGSGLACLNSILWYRWIDDPGNGQWLVFIALEVWGLWILKRVFQRQPGQMAKLYREASWTWSELLLLGLLALLSAIAIQAYLSPPTAPQLLRYSGLATLITLGAIVETSRPSPTNWQFWNLAWFVELAVALGTALREPNITTVAVATLALGLTSQLLGDIWVLKQRQPYRSSWQAIPLAYAALGWTLGHLEFGPDTGYYTLAAAIITIGVGRRQPTLHPFSYLGLVGISWGAYELLIYRLLQAEGGMPGDGITLMAGLALLIALIERWFGHWLQSYLQVRPQGLQSVAHIHWGVGSLLAILAAISGLSYPQGIWLWTVITLLLAGYALIMGNQRWTPQIFALSYETWTWLGLIEIMLSIAYARFELFPNLTFLLTWGGIFACVLGLGLYSAPWETWGWPRRPWKVVGLWLPILTIGITVNQVKTQSLLVVGAFYAWMGKQFDQVRLSYLSVVLLDWAALRYLSQQGWLTALWCNIILGLSVLYLAEVEPYFQDASTRAQRHWLRSFASGLIGLTALYQVEVSEAILGFAGITLLLSLGFILTGLVLRVRAFLYVGTATFVLQVIRILWLFVSSNSLLLWAIGIVLGLAFIWIAATFESRRSQVTTLLESWATSLEQWE